MIGYADQFAWALKAFVADDTPFTRAGLVAATPAFFTRVAAGLGLNKDQTHDEAIICRIELLNGRVNVENKDPLPEENKWPCSSPLPLFTHDRNGLT